MRVDNIGKGNPGRYLIVYLFFSGIAQLIGLFFLVGGAEEDSGVFIIIGAVLLYVLPIYLLFREVNHMISNRIRKYHHLHHILPNPDYSESRLTDLETIDETESRDLYEQGYKSLEHIESTEYRYISDDLDISNERAFRIKEEAKEISENE